MPKAKVKKSPAKAAKKVAKKAPAKKHIQHVNGFMGAPGTGKTAAMAVLEHDKNLKHLKKQLKLDRDLSYAIARKATSRPSRGADDRFKIAGLPEDYFKDDKMIGVYVLANNGSLYGYHPDEFQHGADIIVAEPSIHHIRAVKDHLGKRLTTVLLVADNPYRLERMNGRGTEDPKQIQQRLVEGDAQVYVANMLTGGLKDRYDNMIDAGRLIDDGLHDQFEAISASAESGDAESADQGLYEFLLKYVAGDAGVNDPDVQKYAKGAVAEYGPLIRKATQSVMEQGLIDYIIALDQSYYHPNFLVEGKFRDEIVDIAGESIGRWMNRDE